MRCAILPCLGLLLVAPSLLAQPPIAGPQRPPGNPRREQLDAFGRKLPWGDAVNGSRVCLAFPTNRLLYGQPLQMMLLTRYEVAKPPYPRIQLDEPGRNATVEFTTDKGEQVPFSMRYGGGASGPEGTRHEFRLLPQGRFLRNLDLAPGHYRLRVVIDSKPGPSTRPEWIGKLVTNTLELIVVESTPAGRAELVPEAARELAAALGDPQAEKRRAAAQALLNLGNGAVPAVTDALGSDSPERRETAREVFRRLLTFWPMRDDMNVAHVGIVLAQLPDVGWKALPDNFRPEDIERLRTEAAAVGPVPMEPPPEKQLLAGLHDLAPHVRFRPLQSAWTDPAGRILYPHNAGAIQ
ncbi:MAG: hypothetical protein ACJ8F7_16350, partial [Gemmataceae bacterium]